MKVLVTTLIAALVTSVALVSAADAKRLKNPELKTLLSGKTIKLTAPFGALPIKYAPSGTMIARSRAMQLFSGIYEDRGRWRIANNQFCQSWKNWNKGREQCFTVTRKDGTLHWKSNDGMKGTAYEAK